VTATLLIPQDEEDIAIQVARVLSQQYGDVSVHGTTYDFHQTSAPPDSVISATRDLVIDTINAATVNDECRRRIYDVMQDDVTQLNITASVLDIVAKQQAGYSPTQAESSMIEMARSIKEWISAMRQAARDVAAANDPNYNNDSRWPPPPPGYQAFIAQF
jgi:hypothetical protein